MKKTRLSAALLLLAGAAMLSGCQKENSLNFRLTIVDQAKTTLGANHKTHWQNGDNVYVNGTDDSHRLTVVVDGAGSVDAYTAENTSIPAVNGNQYFAFYAGANYTDGLSASVSDAAQSFTFTAPAAYTYVPANLHSPMAGFGVKANNHVDIYFHNIFTLLELSVPAPACDITITDVATTNTVPLSGTFTTTYSASHATTESPWSTTPVTAADNHGTSLTISKPADVTTVYVPIPAGNHKLNINIPISTTQNTGNNDYSITLAFTAEQKQDYTYRAGYYYKINVNTVKSTSTGVPTNIEVPLLPYPYGDYFFGKGNLRFDSGEEPIWALEEEQWSVTGYSFGTNTVTDAESGHGYTEGQSNFLVLIDNQFGNPTAMNNNVGAYVEAGYAHLLFDIEGDPDWTLPTAAQWASVLGETWNSTSSSSTNKWAYIKISGVTGSVGGIASSDCPLGYGMLIVPDKTLVTLPTGISYGTTYSGGWNSVPTITADQFYALEQQGCLFLPACGYVNHSGQNGSWTSNLKKVTTELTGMYRVKPETSSGSTSPVLVFDPKIRPQINNTVQSGCGVCTRLIFVPNFSQQSTGSK